MSENDVQRSLGRIEGALEAIEGRLDKQDTILHGLKERSDNAAGRNTLIGTLAGLFGGGVVAWVAKQF